MKKLIILSFLLSITALLCGQIINIPAEYPTIQQGINAVTDGDTVLVAQGTYFENINFMGKNITIASNFLLTHNPTDIEQTIIDGNHNESVVKFESGEDTTATIIGFTLINGYSDYDGAGILVDSASPKLEHLLIINNEGHGLSFEYSDSKLNNITVSNNSGSGIQIIWESNLDMDSLIVKYNNPGGGIYCFGSSNLKLKNSSIFENTLFSLYDASGGGLGIRQNCNVNLQNVLIAYNNVLTSCAPFARGGGIYCYMSTLELSGVTVKYNEANHAGGGICSSWNSEIIFDSVNKSSIYSNFAPVGHDIYCSYSNLIQEIILDTFSVTYPTDYYAEPSNSLDFSIDHGLIQQIDSDLYVSADGSNSNSGLTENDPLLNIQYALSILRIDSLHPHQINLLPGTYSPSLTQEYFPINIPDYCRFIGSNATEVILNAGFWGGVLNINNNNENDISGITIKGGNGGMTAGGISCINSSPSLTSLIIEGNSHWNPAMMGQGGGMYIRSSNPVLKNVLIANNLAWSGSGIFLRNSNPAFINCTFSENSGNSGRGIYITGNSNVILNNTIMWSDSLGEIRIQNDDTTYASLSISWSDIHGGLEGINNNGTGTVYWLEGNINEDPLFDTGGNHPFALSDQSPCIDFGTPDTTGLNLPIADIIGNKRIWDGDNNGTAVIDMGAYEYGAIPVNIEEPFPAEFLTVAELEIFPNPFYQSTEIELKLKEKRIIELSIYNQLGERIETIFEGEKETGMYQLTWDSSDLSAGIYFIKLQTEKGMSTQKIIKR